MLGFPVTKTRRSLPADGIRLGLELDTDSVREHLDVRDGSQDRVARHTSCVERSEIADNGEHSVAEEKVGVIEFQGPERG